MAKRTIRRRLRKRLPIFNLKYIAAIAILAIGTFLILFLTNTELKTYVQRFFLKAFASEYYVAPDGSSTGDGSINRPWDITTALTKGGNPAGSVKPGDTIYLREGKYGHGGSYYVGEGHPDQPSVFTILIKGGNGLYITVRNYLGERATIDGGINLQGEYLIVQGLEVTNTDTHRWTDCEGSSPCWEGDKGPIYVRPTGVAMNNHHQKLINNFIHDTDAAITCYRNSYDSEIYGNVIYNYGRVAPDRGHGHGIYFQNITGSKKIIDNIFLPALDEYGVHGYGEAEIARIDNTTLEGNIHYVRRWRTKTNYSSTNVIIRNNYLWNSAMVAGKAENLVIEGNYLGGIPGSSYLNTEQFNIAGSSNFSINNNTVCGGFSYNVFFQYPASFTGSNLKWNSNSYCNFGSRANAGVFYQVLSSGGTAYTFSGWQNLTSKEGFDTNSVYTPSKPALNRIFYRRNQYEGKRGHVAVYNWQQLGSVALDLAQLGYSAGDGYEIHNAYDYFGDYGSAPLKGTYTGTPVQVNMAASRWPRSEIIGIETVPSGSYARAENPYPDFGAFIVVGGDSSTPTSPLPKPSVSPTAAPTVNPTPRPTSSVKPSPIPTPKPTTQPISTNSIKNAGFEDGKNYWTYYLRGESGANSRLFTIKTPGYEGSKSAALAVAKRSNNIQFYQHNIALQPNAKYRLTFAAKSSTGHNLDISLLKHGSPFTNYGLDYHRVDLTREWNTFTVDLTTKNFSSPVSDARLMFWLGTNAAEGDVYTFDNVNLTKI